MTARKPVSATSLGKAPSKPPSFAHCVIVSHCFKDTITAIFYRAHSLFTPVSSSSQRESGCCVMCLFFRTYKKCRAALSVLVAAMLRLVHERQQLGELYTFTFSKHCCSCTSPSKCCLFSYPVTEMATHHASQYWMATRSVFELLSF